MSNKWANGSSAEWRKVRAFVLTRDGYRCRLRLEGCTERATHVHHTGDRRITGDNPDHLVASCAHCNTSWGDPMQSKYGNPPTVQRTNWEKRAEVEQFFEE